MTEVVTQSPETQDALQEKAASELLRSRIVIRRAEELARLGYFIFDCDRNKTTYFSPGLIKIASSLEGQGGEVPYENLLNRVHKDDVKRVEIATRSSIEEGYPLDVEFRTLTSDGEIMHLWMTDDCIDDPSSGKPIRLGIIQDITERRIGEERHRKQAALRRAITRNAIDCIVTFDDKGQILEFNPAAEARFRLPVHQAAGQSYVRTLFHPRYWEALQTGIDEYLTTDSLAALTPRLEVEGMGSAGDLFPLEVTITPVSVNGRKYFSALMRDLTERKAQEKSLRDARDEAEEASQAKTSFLAGMSHELRTPLNGTLGALEALEDTALDAEQHGLIGLARNSGDALLSLINSILDLSRIEARQVDLQYSIFDIRDLIASSMEISACEAKNKKIELIMEESDLISRRCLSDSARIGQILRNLISNAVHNTAQGSITVRVKERPDVDDAEKAVLLFEVEDTGCGVPAAIQESLFIEFVTRSPEDFTSERRAGLGLAISKTLIEALGGKIGFASVEGSGSIFWFTVPVTLPGIEDKSAPVKIKAPVVPRPIKMMKGRVLLAEDSPTNAIVARSVLERRGLEIDHVENGALAVAAARKTKYDLVLMDISMPVMDGLAATRAIRSMEDPGCRVPIIALTARAINGDRDMCCDAGADDYLTKPYRKEKLLSLVASALERSSQSEGMDCNGAKSKIFCLESLNLLWDGVPAEDVCKVIKVYLDETLRREERMKDHIASGNWPRLEVEAHALKSSSRNVGLMLLGEQAEALEAVVTQADEAVVQTLYRELEGTISLSIGALEDHFGVGKREETL